jgi:Flp pilus assembly protein TadG
MRWIAQSFRKRIGSPDNDEGVSLVLTALCLTFLLSMGALVIDVGALVQERRTLQNGADAAALAAALDCGKNQCGAAGATAASFANANADDNAAAVDYVCGNGGGLPGCAAPPTGATGNYVHVGVSTAGASGSIVRFLFAPIIGGGAGRTVTRSAAAAWGKIGTYDTIPVTLAQCAFTNITNPANLPSAQLTVFLKGLTGGGNGNGNGNGGGTPQTCTSGPTTYPGGFSWLNPTSGCIATISVGGVVPGSTGASAPNCLTMSTLQNKTVIIPMYSGFTGTGANGTYTISGFAAFRIEGYRIPGSTWNMPTNNGKCPGETGANGATCLVGRFVSYSTNQGDLTTGGTDFGTTTTKLIG